MFSRYNLMTQKFLKFFFYYYWVFFGFVLANLDYQCDQPSFQDLEGMISRKLAEN